MKTLALAAALASLAAPARAQDSLVNWETPHVHPLELTPDHTRLLAVNLPDNRLEEFDVRSGSPVWLRSLPVGLDPVSVRARSNTVVWVVNQLSDSVSVVDLIGGHVVATLQTDDEPADVVFAGNRAFVTCSQANTVLVFELGALTQAPTRLAIRGEDPRAMAVSRDGTKVYAAIFESGNETTILGNGGFVPFDFPFNVVGMPNGPHDGVSPPPNDGQGGFEPPLGPTLPTPPRVSQIVRFDGNGHWLDDAGGDWTNFVSGNQSNITGRVPGWHILDHDLAIVDVASLGVSYADHLMNLCMAVAVNPATGVVSTVGTDALNEIRYVPNLAGRFLRVRLARVGATGGAASLSDMNPHLDYTTATVAPELRAQTISDPRGIVWNELGTRAYVTGMGTNNVVVLDAAGNRAGLAPTIAVGQGPTGIALDESRQRLYVFNRFEATLSVVSTATELELGRVGFYDPTPLAIKKGRPHLYDARETSGLGLTSCASCHVDARMDRLAWDLGNPQGTMLGLGELNTVADIPSFDTGWVDFHPMKGPMLTQTLQDIIGHEPFHWRGEKTGLEDFNPAFQDLMGDDEQLSAAEMQEFEDFLATIAYPPNPFRNLDNSLKTSVSLEGMHTTGRFGPAGQQLPDGDATRGHALYYRPRAAACINCHTLPTGEGTNWRWNGSAFEEIPHGPKGEAHEAVFPALFQIEQNIKIPSLRNLYERTGCEGSVQESVAGFGFRNDGAIDSLPRFVGRPHFTTENDQEVADLVAFLLSLSGGIEVPVEPLNDIRFPPGMAFQATHAAVGKQATIADGAHPEAAAAALLAALSELAEQGHVGLVVRGRLNGVDRGWYLDGPQHFQSDRRGERFTSAALLATASLGSELTFTAVPKGSERRIGADRDADGALDRDELDLGFDPADPRSRPKAAKR